jgi:hypothetical protein
METTSKLEGTDRSVMDSVIILMKLSTIIRATAVPAVAALLSRVSRLTVASKAVAGFSRLKKVPQTAKNLTVQPR